MPMENCTLAEKREAHHYRADTPEDIQDLLEVLEEPTWLVEAVGQCPPDCECGHPPFWAIVSKEMGAGQ